MTAKKIKAEEETMTPELWREKLQDEGEFRLQTLLALDRIAVGIEKQNLLLEKDSEDETKES